MGLANKFTVPENREKPTQMHLADRGVYVHVPFCSHACDFCAFYQVEPRRGEIDVYLDTIESEFALIDDRDGCATAFWGGGTPGLLRPVDLERLGRAQLGRFGAPTREWTVELAPSSVRKEKLEVLHDLGVTRVSLGVQSLLPRTLDALGRRHSLEQIERAWTLIKAAGFASTNLDLIFAVPGQSLAEWESDLDAAMAMNPDHISTYCLTFEEDTALFLRLSEGSVSIDLERERAFFECAWDRLSEGGFEQYEISNYARPGHASQHNINTWRMGEWLGFGPSAASQASVWRGSNAADLERWREDVNHRRRATDNQVCLTSQQLLEDALIFGLRMNVGVDLRRVRERFGAEALEAYRPMLEGFVADGLAVWDETHSRISLTRAGRMVVDAIGAELVGTACDR